MKILNYQATQNGGFIILTPEDNSYQTILAYAGENACTMTEARMMWPGR